MAKKKSLPSTSTGRFREAASELIRFHEEELRKKGKLSASALKRQSTLRAAFEKADEALLADSDGAPPSLPLDMTEFFAKVSAGVVDAQRNLDDQSLDYLKTVAAQPHALPSIFRIPKVSAEMKFAINTKDSKTVGFLFYKGQTEAEQQHQQTVQFDIVSTPPPPGFIPVPAVAGIVRLKSDRKDILDRIARGPLPGDPNGALRNDFDRVIILEIVNTFHTLLSATATKQYLLSMADASGNLGLWWLQIDNATQVLSSILSFAAPDASLASLRQFIAALGDAQKTFLASLP